MKSFISKIVSAVLPRPSTERALKGFTSALAELRAVVKVEAKNTARHLTAARKHQSEASAATERANRASNLARKIEEFVA